MAEGNSGFAGHPKGLVCLFFTEMWERFSYYGMRAILLLYMVAAVKDGGLGMAVEPASNIYGMYTMLVYMSSIPGGFVADRFLGGRKAVLVGGIIIALGHFTLVFRDLPFFYAGLGLIILGTGLLKPNISAMLGSMYEPGDHRRDGGFSIFYMGINIGAALSPIVCGYLAQSNDFRAWLVKSGFEANSCWHWGFGAAGVGMTLGLLHYVLQARLLGDAGLKKPPLPVNDANPVPEDKIPLTKEEWSRLGAIAILFFFTMLFWTVYEQGGTSLNLFADRLTRCEIFGWEYPSSWLQSWQAVFVIALAPVFSWLWLKLGDKEPSSPAKFAFGLLFLCLGIGLMVPAAMLSAQGKVSSWWLIGCYFLQVVGELCLSPVGLSTATKLAPLRMVGMVMGIWFLANAFANKLSGLLGGQYQDDSGVLMHLFGGMTIATGVGAVILVLLTPTIRKLMSGVR